MYEEGTVDFIAPMMYYSNYNSYPDMDIAQENNGAEAKNCLRVLHEAGWPASRTILTYQSFDALRTSSELPTILGKLLGDFSISSPIYYGEEPYQLKGPYAGVLGWPAQCGFQCFPQADKLNMAKVLEGAATTGADVVSASSRKA